MISQQTQTQVLLDVEHELSELYGVLGEQTVARMALAPYWPHELAVTQLPVPGGFEAAFRRAIEVGLVTTGRGPFPWRGPIYWMNAANRASALRRLSTAQAPGFLRRQLAEAGTGVMRDGGENLEADLTLFRWAQLAAAGGSDVEFNVVLYDAVGAALRQAEASSQLASPEALRWIESAAPLAAILGGGYEAGLAAAKRRFELFYRRGQDRRRLQNYFPREAADRAFETLIGDEQQWALHYIGAGGSGKTMLMRHIGNDLAEPARVAVSRIDFDYLNPEFPRRNACLLLVALAEEFRLQAGSSANRTFARLQSVTDTLYQRLEASERRRQTLQITVDSPEFREVLALFAEALHGMADRRRPLIILDTCEELAKMQSDGGIPTNVLDTFRILEELHTAVDDVRVAFSGRRPLPLKDYLRVFRVEEFTLQEATKFVETYRGRDSATVDADVVPRIVELSRSSNSGEDARFSPYDLDTFAAWVTDEPEFKDKVLAGAGPQLYVKERIVDRVNPMVRRLLPSLAVLGRFDRDLLEALIGTTPNATNDLLEVMQQEWIETDSTAAVETWRLDAQFRTRLLKYYRDYDRSVYYAGRARLAEVLPRMTLERPFSELTVQLFSACLDVLSDTPSTVAHWWQDLEDRIAGEAQWEWAQMLTGHIEAELGNLEPGQQSMLAGVLATKAAVMLHLGTADTLPTWRAVQSALPDYPAFDGQRRLRWRLGWALRRLGQTHEVPPLELARDDQDGATALAAIEALYDSDDAAGLPWFDLEIKQAHIGNTPDQEIFLELLRARQQVLGKILRDEGMSRFVSALNNARERCSELDPRQVWLDWIQPDNLEHRILLELARVDEVQFLAAASDAGFHQERIGGMDTDRFMSAWLICAQKKMTLAHYPTPPQIREQLPYQAQTSLSLLREPPRCSAHNAFPPFFVADLLTAAFEGDVERACTALQSMSGPNFPAPADVGLAIDTAMARICRRMRLLSDGYQLPGSVTNSTDKALLDLVEVTRALHQPVPDLAPVARGPEPIDEFDPLERAILTGQSSAAELAEELYARAEERQDDLACVQLRVMKALHYALSKSGDPRDEALKARPDYEHLALRVKTLPSWDSLESAVSNGECSALLTGMGPQRQMWRPWIVRLLACLSWPNHRDLSDWLWSNDVTIVDGIAAVPPELAFVPRPGTPTAVAVPAPTAAAAPGLPFNTLAERLRTPGLIVLGLAIIGVIALLPYLLVYQPILNALNVQLDQPLNASVYVAVLGIIGVAWQRYRWLVDAVDDLLSPLLRVRATVEYASPPSNPNRPTEAESILIRRSSVFGLAPVVSQTKFKATPAERYAQICSDIYQLQPLQLRLLRLLVLLRLDRIRDTELTVGSDSAGAPWEAILTGFPGLPPRTGRIAVRRTTRDHRATMLPWFAPVEVLTWSVARSSQLGISTLRPPWFSPLFASDRPAYERERPEVGILRVLGMPIDSVSGVAIEIGRYDNDVAETYVVQPSQLLARYPALRICILQCPTAEPDERVSSDRRDAAISKRIAAEIFSSGVPIVIVIPPLSEDLSFRLNSLIDSLIAKRPSNVVPALARTLRRFKRDYVKMASPDPEDAEEIMADIVLYARERVSLVVDEASSKPAAMV